ncbi:MAG: hypothetical protein A3E88_08105 [Legionellales bacterium RIFCSPHIGHO2_12_FULL_35_11]|nr:MAG: hypothetical protein A3E88_08105 [Legionellales bacterium RIFCSPHIGHO2_12_FULL_35_11]
MFKLNPFSTLSSHDSPTNFHPNGHAKREIAKVINSSFSEKVEQSYDVIKGTMDANEKIKILGFTDYLGLIIPYILIDKLYDIASYLRNNAPVLFKLYFIPCAFLLFILNIITSLIKFIVRPILSASLTLAVAIPLICLIHPITLAIKRYILWEINELVKTEVTESSEYANDCISGAQNVKRMPGCYVNYDKIDIGNDKQLSSCDNKLFLWENRKHIKTKHYNFNEMENDKLLNKIMLLA